MRRSTAIAGPVLMITGYYPVLALSAHFMMKSFPALEPFWPFGGIEEQLQRNGGNEFQPVAGADASHVFAASEVLKLAVATISTVLLMIPISWAYFITTKDKDVNPAFAQTIVVLPVIVAGIALIVHGSVALAFSLAGVVAAVRFRLTLEDPGQALFIFAAIAVGLGAGISAVGVAAVVSVAFVYLTLLLWKLDYGDDLNTRFFSFLTGRGRDDKGL